MSKAFTRDDAAEPPPIVVARAPLPQGVPNYVTPRGLFLLQEELERLQAERTRIATLDVAEPERPRLLASCDARLSALETRLGSVELIQPSTQPRDEVRFAAQVLVRTAAGEERRYQLVGVDEADVARGRIAFIAPLSRALLGRRVGDVATLRTPRGEEELEILAIEYSDSR
jgi:transcription elongation factor GreB